jgi:hypothetical protein
MSASYPFPKLKMSTMTDRDNIIASHQDRLRAREALKVDVDEAKVELNPKTQIARWADAKKMQAMDTANEVGRVARKAAPFIGGAVFGALLYVSRRPISKWISKVKKPTSSTED